MPPDAAALIGVVPMLQNFYKQADLHSIWEKHCSRVRGPDTGIPSGAGEDDV